MGFGCKAGWSRGSRSSGLLIRFYKPGDTIVSVGRACASDGSSSLPRRVAFSSGVGEGPGSSLVGLSRVASAISFPLRVIKGDMNCCCSLAALQRMPVIAPDASVQACNAQAKDRIFACLRTQKSEAVVGGRKTWGAEPMKCGQGIPQH